MIKRRRPRNLLLIFQVLTISLLYLYNIEAFDRSMIHLAIGLIAIVYASNFLITRISNGDDYLFLIVSMLLSIGLILVYRIQPEAGQRQLVWIIIGIIFFYLAYMIIKNIPIWSNLFWFYVILGYVMFGLTLILGGEDYGSVNWIEIGDYTIQLSEFTKILLLLIMASYYTKPPEKVPKKFRPYLLMLIVYSYIGLLFIQRDLGSAMIFFAIYIGLLFIYEEDRKLIWINLGLMIAGSFAAYHIFNHVRVRVEIWQDPWATASGGGYQILQSLFAIAEGGFFGTGIGEGFPYLIPKVQFDFIFAAICEEMGMFMGIAVILLFLMLAYRGIKIVLQQEIEFYRILAMGVTILFSVQTFVAIGGVIKFIPMTGITLPFVSYGGSSMLSSFICLALLQVASEHIEFKEERHGS